MIPASHLVFNKNVSNGQRDPVQNDQFIPAQVHFQLNISELKCPLEIGGKSRFLPVQAHRDESLIKECTSVMLSLKCYFTTGFLPNFEAEICDQYLNIHLSEAVLHFNLVGNVKFPCKCKKFHPKTM